MHSNSIISVSPSFDTHSSNLVDIADRVVRQLRIENRFDDIFDVSDDDNSPDIDEDDVNTNTPTKKLEENEEEAPDEDEQEFEFPIVCGESNPSPISADEVLSNSQILPRYPLFDRSLLLDVDPDSSNVVDSSETDSKPTPVARLSLRKLFSEDRDSTSSSSSEADDLERITPGTYCVWKPKTESGGKHKKSSSIDFTSKQWKVRDLLKRSYSDDKYNYSAGKDTAVVLFTPPIPTKQKSNSEKVKKITKTAKVASAAGDSAASTKTDNHIPAHKAKAGINRLPPFLPYRQDQLGGFAHFNGSSRNLYRY